jgi:hypothetical protein
MFEVSPFLKKEEQLIPFPFSMFIQRQGSLARPLLYRHSSFSSTTTCGHYTQASSSAATFPPQEGSFSLTDSQTPKPLKPSSSLGRNFKTPSPLSSPDEDLTIKPGDSISQWQSPTDSPEPSLAPDSPGADSHSSGAFKLRRVRTHSREDLAVLSEDALVAEMVQQVDRKRGGMKLGFRVSPRARLSPSRRKKHPFRSSAGSEAEASDAGRPVRSVRLEISTEELQQALEAEVSIYFFLLLSLFLFRVGPPCVGQIEAAKLGHPL